MHMYSVYVMRNSKGSLYIGFTTDRSRRVFQHQEDEGGWTKGKGPWELVHHEEFADRGVAMRREKTLKRGRTNEELRRRLNQENPESA